MKLQSYNPNEKLNTINAQVANTGNALAYGADKSGVDALQNSLLKAAKVADDEHTERMNVAFMNAETDYNKQIIDKLYNEKDGLAHTELGGAAGSTQKFYDAESAIRQSVLSKLPNNRLVYEKFNRMADDSTVRNGQMMNNHEFDEKEKYTNVTFDNNFDTMKDLAALQYNNGTGLLALSKNLKTNINNTYGFRGEQYTKDLYNQKIDEIGALVLDQLDRQQDFSNVSKITGVLRDMGVSEELVQKLEAKSRKQEAAFDATNGAAQYAASHWGSGKPPANAAEVAYNEKFAELKAKQAKGGQLDASKLKAEFERTKGKPYLEGSDGVNATDCGKWVQDTMNNIGGYRFLGRTADGQYYQLEQAGMIFTDKSQLQPGDTVYWNVPGHSYPDTDDINQAGDNGNGAYKGISHVGIYMGDGMVAQAGTSGVSEIPLDTYPIVGMGRVGSSGKVLTDGEIQAQAKAFSDAVGAKAATDLQVYQRHISDQKKAILLQLDQMDANGATSQEKLNFLNNEAGDNPDLRAELLGKIGSERNAVRREAQAASLISTQDYIYVQQYAATHSLQDTMAEFERVHPGGSMTQAQMDGIINITGNRDNVKALKSEYGGYIESVVDANKPDGEAGDVYEAGVYANIGKQRAAWQDKHGYDPGPETVRQMAADAVVSQTTYQPGGDGALTYTAAQLTGLGITNLSWVGNEGYMQATFSNGDTETMPYWEWSKRINGE